MELSESEKPDLEKHEKMETTEAGKDETGERWKGGKMTGELVTSSAEFFREEWTAFKTERATSWCEKKTEEIALDFDGLGHEWKFEEENEAHWVNQAKKQKESDTCSPLFYSILAGIIFVVIPNGAILLDMLTASEYLGGQWYTKRWVDVKWYEAIVDCSDPHETWRLGEECCRHTEQTSWWQQLGSDIECFEKDPLWGTLTVLFLFTPGVFWSLGIFIQFVSYLRRKNPDKYNQKRVLFFCFAPAAALCAISFPLQLMIVSVIATFNTQVSLNKYEKFNFFNVDCPGPLDHPDQQDRDSRGVLQCSLTIPSPALYLLCQS